MTYRFFALVPAAGHSTRMQEPKLLMPLAGQPLILHTIAAWQRSRVDRIVVVMRPNDRALAEAVALVNDSRLEVVIPGMPPPDMKASLQAALAHTAAKFSPSGKDAFLVAPADMPRLSAAIIDRLIGRHLTNSSHKILAPTLGDRQGHPVLFPWSLAGEVHALGPDEGLNAIVHRYPPDCIPCEDLVAAGEYPFADIDTPEEYQQLTNDK